MKTLAHQIEPAGCSETVTFEQFKLLQDEFLKGWVADEKFDGRRYLLQIRPNGAKHNFLTSRRVSKTTGLMVEKQDSDPHFRDCMFGPKDTVYDGEMLHPDGGTSHEAATAIAKGFAVYRVFDLLRLEGRDVRQWTQKQRWDALKVLAPSFPERMFAVKHSPNPKRLLQAVRAVDGEGIILKNPDAIYGKGWIKVVGVEFVDAIVIGYEMSDSDKYGPKNWIKGVKFGQWIPFDPTSKTLPEGLVSITGGPKGNWALVQMGQTSGFTEAMRAKISENKEKFMGKVMILKFKGREASGALRHPRFHDWHPDKNATECRYYPR